MGKVNMGKVNVLVSPVLFPKCWLYPRKFANTCMCPISLHSECWELVPLPIQWALTQSSTSCCRPGEGISLCSAAVTECQRLDKRLSVSQSHELQSPKSKNQVSEVRVLFCTMAEGIMWEEKEERGTNLSIPITDWFLGSWLSFTQRQCSYSLFISQNFTKILRFNKNENTDCYKKVMCYSIELSCKHWQCDTFYQHWWVKIPDTLLILERPEKCGHYPRTECRKGAGLGCPQ